MTFPVVGIGASAGGVEALQQFFAGLPQHCGMALVVVLHMDPERDGNLVEILQRCTPLLVQQAEDKMPVLSDNVYVIPRDRDITIFGGVLQLVARMGHTGMRLPIDFFLRSLAADMRERSVGVILSGMGSDGTRGLRAIKEVAGSAFVQDPADAKFNSMPLSAIATGLVDVVAPAHALAARVVSYGNFIPHYVEPASPELPDRDHLDLERVIALLRAQTGQDFSLYKKSTLYRRVERRMALHQLPRIADYQRYLRQNQDESALLLKDMLIGVTRFFREPDVWEQLKAEAIPALLAEHPHGGTLRAWTPACSTGEEAYTLAMVFREAVEQCRPEVHYGLQVFATDLDREAIETARAGMYPVNISADVTEARLGRFFAMQGSEYRLNREIRDMVIFAQQNIVMDPPFTKLDLLSCRNLFIYMESDLQRKLLPLFHYCLRPQGILVLGSAETIGDASGLFAALPGKTRLYRRRDVATFTDPVDFPPVFNRARIGVASTGALDNASTRRSLDLQVLTNELLLQSFAPAAVLTNDRGDIVYLCGKAGQYLEPPAGKASMSLFAMAREGLSDALREAFSRAVRERSMVSLKGLRVLVNGSMQLVDVGVQPLNKPMALNGMVLIVFTDVRPPPTGAEVGVSIDERQDDERTVAMAQEMQKLRDELKTMRDEMQTSQEELKSTNEELQSTNEELQSTNEELTTSQEELQSMNEELHLVNHELTTRLDEVSQASDEEINLLNSTGIATLFLDEQLRVRRFTSQATDLFKLIPGDIGRPITDLVTSLQASALEADAQEVLRTLVFKEAQLSARGNRWFNVRIVPYRTRDNRIDGVVITFADITVVKTLEATLRQALELVCSGSGSDTSILGEVRQLLGACARCA
jgi:two-component system CheB/CheR fusion protein